MPTNGGEGAGGGGSSGGGGSGSGKQAAQMKSMLHLSGSNNCIPNGNRLSIHHPSSNDGYDSEITTCCLPPPSPAPNSDRNDVQFIVPNQAEMSGRVIFRPESGRNITRPDISAESTAWRMATQHFQPSNGNDIKFATMHHRSMSPSSRYKSTMSDRYRDVSPKCDRFLPPPHYLANSTPLVSSGGSINNISMVGANSSSSDNYIDGYLSTTVHTPVKRYVPSTNTTAAATSTASISTCTMNGYHNHSLGSNLPQQQLSPQQTQSQQSTRNGSSSNNTMPSYRYRMKCCSNFESCGSGNSSAMGLAAGRGLFRGDAICRPSEKTTRRMPDANQSNARCEPERSHNEHTIGGDIGGATSGSGSNSSASSVRSSMRNNQNDHMIGSESGGAGSGNDAYNNLSTSSIIQANIGSNNGNGTCLHCSTIRRTTGVHQTTQTGPISPTIPQTSAPSMSQWDVNGAAPNDNINDSQSHAPSRNHTFSDNGVSSNTGSNYYNNSAHNRGTLQMTQQQQQRAQPWYPTTDQQQQTSTSFGMKLKLTKDEVREMQMQQQHQQQQHHQQQQQLQSQDSLTSSSQMSPDEASIEQSNPSRKHQIKQYVKREIAKFFGVDATSEERERIKWSERQKRLALRRFGSLKPGADILGHNQIQEQRERELHGDRPDILPVDHIPSAIGYHHRNHNVIMNAPRSTVNAGRRQTLEDEIDIDDDDDDDDDAELESRAHDINSALNQHLIIERKASVPTMLWLGMQYAIQVLSKKVPRNQRQWSRSFAPQYINRMNQSLNDGSVGLANDHYDGITALQDNELFFDSPNTTTATNGNESSNSSSNSNSNRHANDVARHLYMGSGDRNQQQSGGWRTRNSDANTAADTLNQQQQVQPMHGQQQRFIVTGSSTYRGTRISSQLLEGVLDNSRRPHQKKLKLLHVHELDDRYDHRPYFTYWINTVQILVLCLTLICYGFGPIGIGMEQKNGQVLVTSLSLQQVQHQEPRNIWLGPRGDDLVHLGAKFAACMRRDLKILDVMAKTRRQERETACCIRNDDSGCVQSSQADCSVRGLWPTKSISTWKKWSPGESGPGGRISGSVCGLDPKYCDAPASIAPYEWPDDITKWPICRKTNSFSQRFRYKDHTAEHMVCEVIGHPCCISVYGECRITTKEFCDFVNGYFHEEASLCSQVSCLNDICGMFPFISPDIPDQFYRLFTSLCLHAGLIHLAITIAFQHIFMADLERLLGPIRTAILYIGSGIAGNLTSSIFLPYKPEVGPLASIAGVVSSMAVLLLTIHWKQLKRPHMALMKLIFLAMCIFAIGTLPWQQHIVGLMGGIICGTVLTITMVPFLSITKYGRKSKINLVWSCIVLHLVIYASMFILFYLFPMALSSIGWWGTDSMNINNPYNGAIGGGYSVGGNIVACDNNKGMQCGGTSSNGPGGIVRSAINI